MVWPIKPKRETIRAMRFNTDEIKQAHEVRQHLSKTIDEVEHGGAEIVIAKYGKPVAALLSAANLYRYRELDRLMAQLLSALQSSDGTVTLENSTQLVSLMGEAKALLANKGGEHE
ncbi:MAG: type II toxin-antitoxin system Phd/YefM family antitoxin [Burkholderiales bacterium]